MSLGTALLVFVGGGCGSVCRWLVGAACAHVFGRGLPLGTLAANVAGCLVFGFVWELACARLLIGEAARVTLCVGFAGGFTTFSSLIFDSWALWQDRPVLMAANLALQTVLGFAALAAGMHAARLV